MSDTLKVRGQIEAILENAYEASVNKTNLRDIAGATKKINEWVSDLTSHRIESLVDENNVKDAVVTLLNVLYFEGYFLSFWCFHVQNRVYIYSLNRSLEVTI